MKPAEPALQSVRVWDLPTRVFHWSIVLLLAGSWITERQSWMELHFLCGYTLLGITSGYTITPHVGHQKVRHTGVASYTDYSVTVGKDMGRSRQRRWLPRRRAGLRTGGDA